MDMIAIIAGIVCFLLGALPLSLLLRARSLELRETSGNLQVERVTKASLEERCTRIPILEAELVAKKLEVDELAGQVSTFHQMQSTLETRLAEREKSFEEQLKNLEQAKNELSKAFAEISQGALEKNNKMFLSLAEENLKKIQETARGDLEQRKQAIDNLVKPIKESLEKVDAQVKSMTEKQIDASATITEQLKQLAESERRLQGETQNLVKALRNPSQRGRWGEIQLRRVVEMAGMLEYCDFLEQDTTRTENGALRPDMKIMLPGGRVIVVDSKVPLEAYLNAIEEQDDAAKLSYYKSHARQMRDQIKQLSGKRYWDEIGNADCVVMFVPGEPMYGAALEHDPELIEFGVQNRVLIATPVTLIGLLRFVAHGWRQEKLEENAQKISELGKDLYSRMAKVAEHLAKLGNRLEGAVGCYNEAVGSLETRVLPTARKFKELQASTAEDIEIIQPIEKSVRVVESARRKALPRVDVMSLFDSN